MNFKQCLLNRNKVSKFAMVKTKICFNTPAGSGCVDVADKYVGLLLFFVGLAIAATGLAMIPQSKT